MAFYDDKKDFQDNFKEYDIYKYSYDYPSGGKFLKKGFIVCGAVTALIFGLFILIYNPKCAVTYCEKKCERGSSYCCLHQSKAARDYHNMRRNGYSSYSSTDSSSSNSEGSCTTLKYSTSSNNKNSSSSISNTNKYKKKSSSYKKEKDSYGVHDYIDAEDFYYDNYDDFGGYEDAEDYYNEAMEE